MFPSAMTKYTTGPPSSSSVSGKTGMPISVRQSCKVMPSACFQYGTLRTISVARWHGTSEAEAAIRPAAEGKGVLRSNLGVRSTTRGWWEGGAAGVSCSQQTTAQQNGNSTETARWQPVPAGHGMKRPQGFTKPLGLNYIVTPLRTRRCRGKSQERSPRGTRGAPSGGSRHIAWGHRGWHVRACGWSAACTTSACSTHHGKHARCMHVYDTYKLTNSIDVKQTE